jgi:hypothetical protein
MKSTILSFAGKMTLVTFSSREREIFSLSNYSDTSLDIQFFDTTSSYFCTFLLRHTCHFLGSILKKTKSVSLMNFPYIGPKRLTKKFGGHNIPCCLKKVAKGFANVRRNFFQSFFAILVSVFLFE